MNIRQLSIFCTVCEEMNFTKAAHKLYMTQPAVSHAIHELEEEIGYPLFDRLSRKIYLTQAGTAFLEKSTRILELYDDLSLKDRHLSQQALLRLGCSITIANTLLPQMLDALKEKCPQTPVKVEINNAEKIEEKLMKNKIDIALMEGAIHQKLLEKHPFTSFELKAFCSPSHPFALRKSISIEEFTKEKLLLREKGSAVRDTLDGALLLHNITADPAWTSVNSQALIQGVKQNQGVSLLPAVLIQEEIENNTLVTVEVEGLTLQNNAYIVYHKDKYLNEAMKALIRYRIPQEYV